MNLRRSDLRINPSPPISTSTYFLHLFFSVHVDAAVEIAVGLLDHREADRLPRPTERHRKRVIATDELRKRMLAIKQKKYSTEKEEVKNEK